MVKRFVIALLLVVLVCGGLVGFNLFRSKMIGQFFAHMPVPSVAVSTTKVEPSTWTPEIDAIGTLWAFQGVDVASEAAGVVKSIDFKANEQVDAGARLVQIDDAVERADLMSAEAAVARDQSQLERAERLRATGVNSQATLQDAESALAAFAVGARQGPGGARPEGDQGAVRRHDRDPARRRRAIRAARNGHRHAAAARHDEGRISPCPSSRSTRSRWASRQASG